MPEDSVQKEINGSPEAVWAKVGNFGELGAVFPTLESFRLEGDDRIIGMFGLEIRERKISVDDESMILKYSVIEGVPLESHTATITVVASDEGALVTWAFDVTPAEMLPIFADTYKGALEALAASFA